MSFYIRVSLWLNWCVGCNTLLKSSSLIPPTDIVSIERPEGVDHDLVNTLKVAQDAIRSKLNTSRSVVCGPCTSRNISMALHEKEKLSHLSSIGLFIPCVSCDAELVDSIVLLALIYCITFRKVLILLLLLVVVVQNAYVWSMLVRNSIPLPGLEKYCCHSQSGRLTNNHGF